MRTQLRTRQHAARRQAGSRSKRWSITRPRTTPSNAVGPLTETRSTVPSSLRRAIRVGDRELFRRVGRVQGLEDLPREGDGHSITSLGSQGWRWRRRKTSFELYTRQTPTFGGITGAPIGTEAFSAMLDSEVLAVGDVACSIAQLAPPLRSPNENDYNSVMHALYGSDFIYGSLVHIAATSRHPNDSNTHNASRQERDAAHMPGTRQDDDPGQLLVKTSSFVHAKMFDKKNEQMCHAELFTTTPSGGFSIAFCSLAARELTAGTLRAPMRRSLLQLHPFSAWFSAEPVNTGVHVVFRARFHRSESDGSCSPKVASARLWRIVKGVSRLGKLVVNIVQPPRALTGREVLDASAGHRNSRCIVCTRNLCHVFMPRRCSRCELCSYNVCDACCSRQRVSIYNRHVVPLLVCVRCRECLARDEFASQLRAVSPTADDAHADAEYKSSGASCCH